MTNNFTPKKASDNRPKLSKEEYAEKKKAEKEAVYQMADEAVEEIVNDPEKFTAFLDTQSRMDRYFSCLDRMFRLFFCRNIGVFHSLTGDRSLVNRPDRTFNNISRLYISHRFLLSCNAY